MLAGILAGGIGGEPVKRVRRGETAGESRNARPVSVQLALIAKAKAKRARKAARRLEQR